MGDGSDSSLTGLDVVELIKQNLTCTWSEKTVDTFKAGNPENEITGIACTFMATVNVLKKAAELGCNLIITHEPTYYNHLDSKAGLENDPVYAAKQEQHKIPVESPMPGSSVMPRVKILKSSSPLS